MPTINISQEVMSHLQSHAIPFVDTPDSTLRRLLGIDDVQAPTSAGRTKQEAFRQPILDALKKLGGKGHKKEVLKLVEQMMPLTDADREVADAVGRISWKLKASWESSAMKRDGVLLKHQRGIWELPFDTIPRPE